MLRDSTLGMAHEDDPELSSPDAQALRRLGQLGHGDAQMAELAGRTRPSPGAATSAAEPRPGSPAAVLHDGAPGAGRSPVAARAGGDARGRRALRPTIPRPPAPRHPAIPRRPRPPRSTSSACCWSAAVAPSMKWSSCASSRTSSEAGVQRPGAPGLLRQRHRSVPLHAGRRPEANEAARDRIFDAARKTITRFEFGGRIYQGGIPPESDG